MPLLEEGKKEEEELLLLLLHMHMHMNMKMKMKMQMKIKMKMRLLAIEFQTCCLSNWQEGGRVEKRKKMKSSEVGRA